MSPLAEVARTSAGGRPRGRDSRPSSRVEKRLIGLPFHAAPYITFAPSGVNRAALTNPGPKATCWKLGEVWAENLAPIRKPATATRSISAAVNHTTRRLTLTRAATTSCAEMLPEVPDNASIANAKSLAD